MPKSPNALVVQVAHDAQSHSKCSCVIFDSGNFWHLQHHGALAIEPSILGRSVAEGSQGSEPCPEQKFAVFKMPWCDQSVRWQATVPGCNEKDKRGKQI